MAEKGVGRYVLLHQGCAPPVLVLILFTIYFLPATLVAHKVIKSIGHWLALCSCYGQTSVAGEKNITYVLACSLCLKDLPIMFSFKCLLACVSNMTGLEAPHRSFSYKYENNLKALEACDNSCSNNSPFCRWYFCCRATLQQGFDWTTERKTRSTPIITFYVMLFKCVRRYTITGCNNHASDVSFLFFPFSLK